MKNLSIVFFILLLGCSGSKEFDNIITPIGGEEQVRSILLNELGSDYYNLSDYRLSLYVNIDEQGFVSSVGSMYKPANWMDSIEWTTFHKTVRNAFIDHIQFTPAIKDGRRIPANFRYYLTF
ncbi:MAG: hypothetical protein KJN64_01750 [Ignavibacteria bacterium]|nr:hypothetical protein [Ignavibacteria bacterium]MBT8381748.1 hypothetical protein [Ignavibacteria bacterium]